MVNLTVHQRANLELILSESKYRHRTKARKLIFGTIDSSELIEAELQAHIDGFDLLYLVQQAAVLRLGQQADAYEQLHVKQYPATERELFHIFRQEVQAFDLDNATLTPSIDTYATGRGVNRLVLIDKIRARISDDTKVNILARRKKRQDLVNASSDIDFINSINFEA